MSGIGFLTLYSSTKSRYTALSNSNKISQNGSNSSAITSVKPVPVSYKHAIPNFYIGRIAFGSSDSETKKSYGEIFLEKLSKSEMNEADLVKSAVKMKNFIGQGGYGAVYSIPEFDDYVIKVPADYIPENDDKLSSAKVKLVDSNIPDGINVGQPVAEIGCCEILPRVKGENFTLDGKISLDIAYKRRLQLAAKLPQDAYDELANFIVRLNKIGHSIDSGIENVLIEKGKGFNPIDLDFNSNKTNEAVNLFVLLLGSEVDASEDTSPEWIKLEKIIMRNCLLAGHKAGMPILPPAKLNDVNSAYRCDYDYLAEMLNIVGIKVNIDKLQEKYYKTQSKKNTESFQKYLDKMFKLNTI